jgi:hypothetical protein
LLSLLGTISASAPGVLTTQLSPPPPASNNATEVLGSSERRPATAQPPEPPPTTTKSNVSATHIPPDRCYHALLVLVVARGEAKQSRSHRIQSLGLFGGLVEGVSLEISYSKAGLLPSFRRER